MLNIREQILKVLKIEDVAQHLMGSPISVSVSSKWNIVYSSFYSSDTNPSFKISTRLQRFCCFSTHHNGDAIDLYNEFERVTKNRRLENQTLYKEIIGKFNLNIKADEESTLIDKKHTTSEIKVMSFLRHIIEYGSYNLVYAADSAFDVARKYLMDKRGLTTDTIITFDLGFINDQNQIDKIICDKKYDKDCLIEWKVLNADGIFPLLNRILIPIKDTDGNIVSLVGRSINENDTLRYVQLSLHEDLINLKPNCYLYGLDIAKPYIDAFSSLYICEGYFDVMMLYQKQIRNAVAIQTTNITQKQLEELKELKSYEIIAFLDADESGQSCQEILAKNLSQIMDKKDKQLLYRKVSIFTNPDYLALKLDPCEFALQYSEDDLLKKIQDYEDYREGSIKKCCQRYIKEEQFRIKDLYDEIGLYINYYNDSCLNDIKDYVYKKKKIDIQDFERLFSTDINIQALYLMHKLGFEKFYCEELLNDSKNFINSFKFYSQYFNEIYDLLVREGDLNKIKVYKSIDNRKLYGLKKTKLILEYGEQNKLEFRIELDYIKGDLVFFKRFPTVQTIIQNGSNVRDESNFFDVDYFTDLKNKKDEIRQKIIDYMNRGGEAK